MVASARTVGLQGAFALGVPICAMVLGLATLPACGSKTTPYYAECTFDSDCDPGEHCAGWVCRPNCVTNADCTDPSFPNCDPTSGRCQGPCTTNADCPDPAFPNCGAAGICIAPCVTQPDCTNASFPNCGTDGLCFDPCLGTPDCVNPSYPNCNSPNGVCFGPCLVSSDCIDPANPNCDDASGLCQGDCPAEPCPPNLPNCAGNGVCFADCVTHPDCVNPAEPNCDPATGLCQGPCPQTPCPPDLPNCDANGLCLPACQDNSDCPHPSFPNCDPAVGLCVGPCTTNADCPDPAAPNCSATGECVGPCAAHGDCTLPVAPNCSLDASQIDYGLCGPPCVGNDDCPSRRYPNCDPSPGTCNPPCTGNGDCPSEQRICDIASGLCFDPECTQDSDCNPPTTVCESYACVPGCTGHRDCRPSDRCDLVDAGNLNHCEPRDCIVDGDCNPPATVCDASGLVDPDGGGYCVPGCQTYYDCRSFGYDCDPSTGGCTAKSYGDTGQDCGGGCQSGFCLTTRGNVCTNFCCTQHDCPADFACRPVDDGTGSGRTVDVCVPQSTAGLGRYNDSCSGAGDCRSGICRSGTCRESCCSDDDCDQPFVVGRYCGLSGGGRSACETLSATGIAPVGTLGCSTTGTPALCKSNLCLTYSREDVGCAACDSQYPTCWDWPVSGNPPNGVDDCVRDMCVDHCCKAADCGPGYYCGKLTFGAGDFDVCMFHFTIPTVAEGGFCASDGECLSRFCSGAPTGVCRARCCTDADCTDAAYPSCKLELFNIFGASRWLNVCQP